MPRVSIDERGVTIDGRRTTLLCASMFYFRVPEQLWGDRLDAIKAAGYACIDAYFPWSFHERTPGAWDFETGMRNAARFLDLAAERGLFVIARPGPYICSEWDGGSLPAWLPAQGIALRQNDPAFLDRVREWFARILPIIAERQLGRSGTVILVQVENELDFFDCADPAGYLAALRDMARGMGITVPLVACAGQGGFASAWAGVSGIVPVMNLYLDPLQEGLESGVAAWADLLSRLGFPLLVMETGREVLLLRRLLSCGAKLLSPYNQVGGCDFGFTNSVNNWGHPLSFQTSHYDFGSLVSAFGAVRGDVWEDRALAGFLGSLGPVLAGALPCWDHGMRIECDGSPARTTFPALRLLQRDGEGFAVAVHNTGDAPLRALIARTGQDVPAHGPMTVAPRSSAFALIQVSLSAWDLPGTVLFSSAEPVAIRGGSQPRAVFQATGPAEVRLDVGGGVRVFRFDGEGIAREPIRLSDGRTMTLVGMHRRSVTEATLRYADAAEPSAAIKRRRFRPRLSLSWKLAPVAVDGVFPVPAPANGSGSLHVESNGGYRGFALYRTRLPWTTSGALGLMLHDAADVLSLYCGERFLGTQVPGGTHAWFPLPPAACCRGSIVRVRCEIWGHSNFDDARLPAMRIGSCRGISKATLVTRKDLLFPWELAGAGGTAPGLPELGHPGGGLTTRVPARIGCSCTVAPDAASSRFLLWAEGIESPAVVEVDGRTCGWIDRLHPVIDLGDLIAPGRAARLTLAPQKWYAAEALGRIFFAQGMALERWEIARAEEPELLASAAAHDARARPARLPVELAPGAMAWLSGIVRPVTAGGYVLTLGGANLKATVFLDETLVGRIFLPSPARPAMAGGRDDCAWLPPCWLAGKEPAVRILLESIGPGPGRLDAIAADPAP